MKVYYDSSIDRVASLTGADRTTWGKAREELIQMDEVNKKSLEAIETALFVVVFEDDSPQTVEVSN